MNKLTPIDYIENSLSYQPKIILSWVTEGIVINNVRYSIKEFRLKEDGKLYAVIADNKYNSDYFEVQLFHDEEVTLEAIQQAIKENKASIDKEITDRKAEITRVENKIPMTAGGRNLAQGTSKDWSTPFTDFDGTENTIISLYKVLVDGLSVGDKLKTHIVLKYDNIVPADEHEATCWLQGSGNVTDWGAGAYNGSTHKTLSGSGEVVFEHEFPIEAAHLQNSYWEMQFRTDYIASGSLQWKLVKVETGDLSTPWTPAPEDYDSKLDTVKSETKQTTDALTTKINQEITDRQNEITRVDGKVTELQGNIKPVVSEDDGLLTVTTEDAQIKLTPKHDSQKQNTLTSNSSIGIEGNALHQLYTSNQTYTGENGVLKTHVKSVSSSTNVSVAEEEFNFTLKINQGQQSATFTLNEHDKTKFNSIITTYGADSSVRINGCLFALSDSTLTVSTEANTGSNYVMSFSDII